MEQTTSEQVEQKIYQLLSQSFIRLDTGDQHLMRRFGLTLTQSWALVHLEGAEGRSLTELAQLLMCDKSNVTSIVDKMEEDGLAVRKRGKAGDRRYTRVVLTERGQKMRQQVIAAREHMVRERLSTLSPHELHHLYASLQHLSQLLTAQLADDEEARIIEHVFESSQHTHVDEYSDVSQ